MNKRLVTAAVTAWDAPGLGPEKAEVKKTVAAVVDAAVCTICPHHCVLRQGQSGLCRARVNSGGRIVCANYGRITACALDPIEKKPLRCFYAGSKILSIGSYGCNLSCPFCQNYTIAQTTSLRSAVTWEELRPEQLAELASELAAQGNIGVAYTYNEPLIGYEFVLDCARAVRERKLKNVLVTNGYICAEQLSPLLSYIDAWNIDLKGFSQRFYDWVGGDLATVKQTIKAVKQAGCHVEITTLIIPGYNDSTDEMRQETAWLAELDPDIPLHITRFFPRWRMSSSEATPLPVINRLTEVAREQLNHVYAGNC